MDGRGEFWSEEAEMGVISIEIILKAMKFDEVTTKGCNNREKSRGPRTDVVPLRAPMIKGEIWEGAFQN